MKAGIFFALLAVTFACHAQDLSEETLIQIQEVSRRTQMDGMSYQVVKRCGADAGTLKNLKAYLYKDIEKIQRRYPKAKVDTDGLFEMGAQFGDETYETAKSNPKFCEKALEEAEKYASQSTSS